MGEIIQRPQGVLWWDEGKPFNSLGLQTLGVGTTGITDMNDPGSGTETTYGTSTVQTAIPVVTFNTPPSGTYNVSVEYYESTTADLFKNIRLAGAYVTMQERVHPKGVPLDNPRGWSTIRHLAKGVVNDITPGPVASREFDGKGVVNKASMTFPIDFKYIRPTLTAQSNNGAAVNANCIVMISETLIGNLAYPGPDKIGYIGLDAAAGVTAKVLYTSNGSTWAVLSNAPFAADEHITTIAYQIISATHFRLIVGCGTTDAAAKAKIAYADIPFSNPSDVTWTVVISTLGSNGDVVTALCWSAGWFSELLIVANGKIYRSTNQGESFGTALTNGSTTINSIATTPQAPSTNEYAYFVGASNLIQRKAKYSTSVQTLVGPSGGGTMTHVAVASDGTLYVGNGTKLYRSIDNGLTAGGWVLVKDFLTDKAIKHIQCVRGASNFIVVVIDDPSPSDGQVYISVDGVGFELVTGLTNGGYNAAYSSITNPNFVVIVGDDDTTNPVIQLLAP